MNGTYPVPTRSSWNLFLGVAPDVEYHPIYHPFNWRGWVDWGQGALGDMGAHLVDHPVWALKLGLPTVDRDDLDAVQQGCRFRTRRRRTTSSRRAAAMPAVKLTWYDGGLTPPKPEEMGDEERLNGEGGILYIGSKGKMLQNTYGGRPRLLPMDRAQLLRRAARKARARAAPVARDELGQRDPRPRRDLAARSPTRRI